MIKVGVLGATGYAGQELIRILYRHEGVTINKIISDTYKDKEYQYIYRNFTGFNHRICEEINWETLTDGIDLLFSALSYGVLMQHLTEDMMKKVKIIDIGVDYRLMDHDSYKKYYGMEHQSMELAHHFTYGLSEWNREQIKKSKYIANPGCYATAAQLALLPLIKENVIEKDIIVDGKCGLSGGGRTLTIGTHFTEANESAKAYKLNNHPHGFEIAKGIEYFTKEKVSLTFTPHIVPMQRGMLLTAYLQLKSGISDNRVRKIYHEYYKDMPFIHILDKGIYVETKWVKNSNICHINFEINEDSGKLIVVAAIDNLIKGAAGQAVQNMNIMLGFPENMALDNIPICL